MRIPIPLVATFASGTCVLLLASLVGATQVGVKSATAPAQPKVAAPVTAQPKVAAPAVAQPKVAAPATAQPKVAAPAAAAPAQPAATGPEPAPPPNQTYIGVTKCSSCHFDKYTDWKKQQDKHAKAFDILPASYKADASCLKCHATGFGTPSGFKTAADRGLMGVTCEVCHGPGSAHAEIAKPFAQKKQKTAAEDKIARDSIYKVLPDNVCITCHTSRSHKIHPAYKK